MVYSLVACMLTMYRTDREKGISSKPPKEGDLLLHLVRIFHPDSRLVKNIKLIEDLETVRSTEKQ